MHGAHPLEAVLSTSLAVSRAVRIEILETDQALNLHQRRHFHCQSMEKSASSSLATHAVPKTVDNCMFGYQIIACTSM